MKTTTPRPYAASWRRQIECSHSSYESNAPTIWRDVKPSDGSLSRMTVKDHQLKKGKRDNSGNRVDSPRYLIAYVSRSSATVKLALARLSVSNFNRLVDKVGSGLPVVDTVLLLLSEQLSGPQPTPATIE